jgi:hypothetical protein
MGYEWFCFVLNAFLFYFFDIRKTPISQPKVQLQDHIIQNLMWHAQMVCNEEVIIRLLSNLQ